MTQAAPLPGRRQRASAGGLTCAKICDEMARRFVPGIILALALAGAACDGLECEGLRVDILNSDQSLRAVQIIAPDEHPGEDKLLHPGEERRIVPCVRVGDRRTFRALSADGGEALAVVNCVVSRSGSNIQDAVARVVWDPRGLVCENW